MRIEATEDMTRIRPLPWARRRRRTSASAVTGQAKLTIATLAAAAASVAIVNFAWPVTALAEVRRRLLAQGSGRILVMSSVASIRIRPSAYLHGGAKAGLDRLCNGLADSLAGTGVTLQLVRPGVVRTRMTKGQSPVPFTTGPDEVAGYVMKGLETNDRVIWSPPILRFAFAALRHLPKPIWRKVADR